MENCTNIIPSDNTTLFISSGMQELKPKFHSPDNTTHSSLQSCVRTTDLDQIGDGTHLSSFSMVGNFSFGKVEYKKSCEMWLEILEDLQIKPDYVTFHVERPNHGKIWESLGQKVVESEDCVWSDGEIGGHCTEIFKSGVEIGNLVNTLDTMTDVGFGLERILMFLENKSRVDETSLFSDLDSYILRDHLKTLDLFWKNGILPGSRGREYICRVMIRRCLVQKSIDYFSNFEFFEWFQQEELRKIKIFKNVVSNLTRHRNKDYKFWKDTFGILPEELDKLRKEKYG